MREAFDAWVIALNAVKAAKQAWDAARGVADTAKTTFDTAAVAERDAFRVLQDERLVPRSNT